MGLGTCSKCGGFLEATKDMSPTLWCSCPLFPIEKYPDENLDPSEDPDYYEEDDQWENY